MRRMPPRVADFSTMGIILGNLHGELLTRRSSVRTQMFSSLDAQCILLACTTCRGKGQQQQKTTSGMSQKMR